MRKSKQMLLVLAMLVGAWQSAVAQPPWWDRRWKCRRQVVAFGLVRAYPGDDVGYAWFYTHGKLKADGSDIRVVAGMELVPHQVLSVGSGDEARVIFRLIRNVRNYHIYFGNPTAPKISYPWQPRRGLKLTTSKYNGGGVNNWQQAKLTFDRSGPVFGVGYVKRIFLGHNPYGPSTNFCARFEGWIDCPRAGEYTFATTSGNASFLFVDGQRVVDWPGWHRPVPNARHQGRVWLERGIHKIEYYGIHNRGRVAFVAAWRPPEQWMFRVIPKSAYLDISRAEVKNIEVIDRRVVPDFLAENEGEATLTGEARRYLTRIKFKNTYRVTPMGRYSWRWDFGDGNHSEEYAPTHVYLAPGVYTVKVTLRRDGSTYETTQKIDVQRDWARQTEVKIDGRESYYSQIAEYNFAKMPVPHLLNAFDYFDEIEKRDDAITVGKILLGCQQPLDEQVFFKKMLRLAELLVRKKDGQGAAAVYERALTKLTRRALVAQIALERADVLLVRLGKLVEAEQLYNKVLQDRDLRSGFLRRRALIGQGDIWWQKGDYQKAEAAYLQAERIPVVTRSRIQEIAMPAAFARVVEGYLNEDKLEPAREHLARWQWERPTDKLRGDATLLAAKLFIAEDERRLAVRALEALVGVNPDSESAPEALSLLADCEIALGHHREALRALETLKTDYPESPLQEGLDERIARVSKFVKPKR